MCEWVSRKNVPCGKCGMGSCLGSIISVWVRIDWLVKDRKERFQLQMRLCFVNLEPLYLSRRRNFSQYTVMQLTEMRFLEKTTHNFRNVAQSNWLSRWSNHSKLSRNFRNHENLFLFYFFFNFLYSYKSCLFRVCLNCYILSTWNIFSNSGLKVKFSTKIPCHHIKFNSTRRL